MLDQVNQWSLNARFYAHILHKGQSMPSVPTILATISNVIEKEIVPIYCIVNGETVEYFREKTIFFGRVAVL